LRGLKINNASRKLDIVLVAARYKEDGSLEFARGYERRGYVWSDLRIYDRDSLIKKVRAGAQVYTGNPVEVPGNYEPDRRVRIEGQDGSAYLVTNGNGVEKDDLSLPVL
jgi:hypothetical protein